MSFIPRPQEIYKHFKGNLYQVTAVAEHTETREQLVIYQALYGDFKIYARPLDMFVSRVDREKYPDVEQEFRFERQGPGAERRKPESEPEAGTAAETAAGIRGRSAEAVQGTAQETAQMMAQERMPEDGADGTKVQPADEEEKLDPFVLEFLDADSYEQRLNILAGLHHRITDEMITTMAIACDIEIDDGDIEERYEALKTCLLTLERYECNRLR